MEIERPESNNNEGGEGPLQLVELSHEPAHYSPSASAVSTSEWRETRDQFKITPILRRHSISNLKMVSFNLDRNETFYIPIENTYEQAVSVQHEEPFAANNAIVMNRENTPLRPKQITARRNTIANISSPMANIGNVAVPLHGFLQSEIAANLASLPPNDLLHSDQPDDLSSTINSMSVAAPLDGLSQSEIDSNSVPDDSSHSDQPNDLSSTINSVSIAAPFENPPQPGISPNSVSSPPSTQSSPSPPKKQPLYTSAT